MSKKEYLNMADVFPDGAPGFPAYWNDEKVKYAAHAINSHDELVEENEGLRELIIRIGMYFEVSGWRAEKESDNLIRQWLYDSIAFMYGGAS